MESNREPTIVLLRDMAEEGWKSMDRYADNLYLALDREPLLAETRLAMATVKKTNFLRPARAVCRYLPWLKNYAHDLYFSRFVKYALAAGRLTQQAAIGHVLDHSYAHLVTNLRSRYKVATCHDLLPLFFEKDESLLKLFRYSLKGLGKADLILADSRETKKDLVRELGLRESKIRVVPLGVDLVAFQPTAERARRSQLRDRLGLPPGKIVLNVGNNLPYKNISRLLKAVAKVRQGETGAVNLIQVGRLSEAQKALARELGLQENITELVDVSDGTLRSLYNLADVYLQPSLKEGFGFPVLEALSCGTPVIVSQGTALAEICGKVGIYVDPLDVDSIAAKLHEVLFNYNGLLHPRPSQLRAQAEKFSWAKTARLTAEAYVSLRTSINKEG